MLVIGKKIIIFCTQLLFSGDGARVFTDLLKSISYTVIYAKHFNMPNNICNFFLAPNLLQDLWELGSSLKDIVNLIQKHTQISEKIKVLDLTCRKGLLASK